MIEDDDGGIGIWHSEDRLSSLDDKYRTNPRVANAQIFRSTQTDPEIDVLLINLINEVRSASQHPAKVRGVPWGNRRVVQVQADDEFLDALADRIVERPQTRRLISAMTNGEPAKYLSVVFRVIDADIIDLLRVLIGVGNVGTSPDRQLSARRLPNILIFGVGPLNDLRSLAPHFKPSTRGPNRPALCCYFSFR